MGKYIIGATDNENRIVSLIANLSPVIWTTELDGAKKFLDIDSLKTELGDNEATLSIYTKYNMIKGFFVGEIINGYKIAIIENIKI